jgi:hypothetical protein
MMPVIPVELKQKTGVLHMAITPVQDQNPAYRAT